MQAESRPANGPVTRSAFGCITIPFLLIAAIPLGWGARGRWKDGALLRSGVAVEGRVTDVRHAPEKASLTFTGRHGRGGNGRTPVVEFATSDGRRMTAIGSINRDPPEYQVGQTAVVVYDPVDPTRADVRTELERWRFWFVVWVAVGLVPVAIALLPVLLLLRERRGR